MFVAKLITPKVRNQVSSRVSSNSKKGLDAGSLLVRDGCGEVFLSCLW